MKKWFAVYTKPRWEKKVAELFERRKVEAYCPLNKVVRMKRGSNRLVTEPVFESWVFVKFGEENWRDLLQVDGVLQVMFWLSKPAQIRDVEIDMMRRFLDAHPSVRLEQTAVNLTDMVKLSSGAMMDRNGDQLSVRQNAVRVTLPSIGYILVAEEQEARIQLLDASADPAESTSDKYPNI